MYFPDPQPAFGDILKKTIIGAILVGGHKGKVRRRICLSVHSVCNFSRNAIPERT
jgi:hypothetical protein